MESSTTTKLEDQTTDSSLNTSQSSIDDSKVEEFDEEEIKKAENFKNKGNEAFKSNNFANDTFFNSFYRWQV